MSDKVAVKIDWLIPDDLKTVYSNNIVVQHTDDEFIISFFEILHPLLLGTADDVRKSLEGKDVTAKCVARVIIPLSKIDDFIKTLNKNYARYLDRQESKVDSELSDTEE